MWKLKPGIGFKGVFMMPEEWIDRETLKIGWSSTATNIINSTALVILDFTWYNLTV